jgi:excisionase family DNA binding protein
MRKPKPKSDLRKIRLCRCYSIQEVAKLLGVGVNTVRAWIRLGLPVLGSEKPILIPGDGLKNWLKARGAARKHKCLPDELYCLRCRRPRKAKTGSAVIAPRNSKTVVVQACCATCDARMNKTGSLAKILEIQISFGLKTLVQVNLEGCDIPIVNQHLEKETIK